MGETLEPPYPAGMAEEARREATTTTTTTIGATMGVTEQLLNPRQSVEVACGTDDWQWFGSDADGVFQFKCVGTVVASKYRSVGPHEASLS
jgi:hypothetical protein